MKPVNLLKFKLKKELSFELKTFLELKVYTLNFLLSLNRIPENDFIRNFKAEVSKALDLQNVYIGYLQSKLHMLLEDKND